MYNFRTFTFQFVYSRDISHLEKVSFEVSTTVATKDSNLILPTLNPLELDDSNLVIPASELRVTISELNELTPVERLSNTIIVDDVDDNGAPLSDVRTHYGLGQTVIQGGAGGTLQKDGVCHASIMQAIHIRAYNGLKIGQAIPWKYGDNQLIAPYINEFMYPINDRFIKNGWTNEFGVWAENLMDGVIGTNHGDTEIHQQAAFLWANMAIQMLIEILDQKGETELAQSLRDLKPIVDEATAWAARNAAWAARKAAWAAENAAWAAEYAARAAEYAAWAAENAAWAAEYAARAARYVASAARNAALLTNNYANVFGPQAALDRITPTMLSVIDLSCCPVWSTTIDGMDQHRASAQVKTKE